MSVAEYANARHVVDIIINVVCRFKRTSRWRSAVNCTAQIQTLISLGLDAELKFSFDDLDYALKL